MVRAAGVVLCILLLSFNLALYNNSAAEIEGERPKSPIEVNTEKTDYYTGEIVKIKGYLPELTNGQEVNIIVKNANGGTFTKLKTKPTSDNSFAVLFQIPSHDKLLPTGKWTIKISYAIWAKKVNINVLVRETVPLNSVTIFKPEIVSVSAPDREIKAGDKVMIISEVKNEEEREQHIFYIVKVKNDANTTVMLNWLSGILGADEMVRFTITWMPEFEGKYTLETFVWDDIVTPTPLSSAQNAELTVSK